MKYIVDYSIVSAAYLVLTAVFYYRQPKVPGKRNQIFGILLCMGIVFAAMDIFVAVLDSCATRPPFVFTALANSLFLIVAQLMSLLFFLYCLTLTGYANRMPRAIYYTLFMPFAAMAAMLVISPYCGSGVFYLDEMNVYMRGELYYLIYINTGLYVASSIIAMATKWKRLSTAKRLSIVIFISSLIVAIVVQYLIPELLLNATANAVALILIYYILESPSTNVDAITGLLNRTALPELLRDIRNQEKRFSVVILKIDSFRAINESIGMTNGDALLRSFADYLRKNYYSCYILRLTGGVFILISANVKMTREELIRITDKIPQSFPAGRMKVRITLTSVAINSEDCDASGVELASLCESTVNLMRENKIASGTIADRAVQRELFGENKLGAKLREAIGAENSKIGASRIEVFYQPISAPDGKLEALEALLRIKDGNGNYLPTQEAVEFAESTGSIKQIGEIVLEKVCRFIRSNGVAEWGLHHIGVNLSAVQLTYGDLPDRIEKLLTEYSVPRDLIGFEITETAAVSTVEVSRNMKRMREDGFSFLMDDFGKGYANFDHIAELPLICVKIDKSILWNASKSEENLAFLKGIASLISYLGLVSVCEGVETAGQVELLSRLGVGMLQGFYFSKPLPEEELLKFVAERGIYNAV